MEHYIDVDRSFAPIPRDYRFKEEEHELALSLGFSGLSKGEKWAQLLQLHRVIILAESGSGKTREIYEATERLRTEGKNAFFLRLENLWIDFDTSFEIGTDMEFADWLATDKPGWFFLDSVDEAKLENPKNFSAAIRKFSAKLGSSKQRAHIYITSRMSEWYPQTDLSFVKEKLPYIEPASVREENSGATSIDSSKMYSRGIKSASRDGNALLDPPVFSLLPLDKGQIRTFAQANGVQQVDAFLDAIEKAEADTFAGRPQDLIDLIDYWNEKGEIAHRARLIQSSLVSKLRERDPDRNAALPLTAEEARRGAEMLAAAVTFQSRNRILIPERDPDPAIKNESIDPSSVLTEWHSNSIRALLQRPVFDAAVYGAVRFHNRSVREFLTAKWLSHLLVKGKSRHAIVNLFFKTMYGQEYLVPSMRPILAWLILFDDGIRSKTAALAPEVFIQGGDPSSLPTEIRKSLLIRFCEAYAGRADTDLSFSLSEVRRFAHPDLDDTINGLLDIYSQHEEIRRLLLRMVWQGGLAGCSEKAYAFAMDDHLDTYTRSCGIRAVAAAGPDAQQDLLVKSLLVDLTSRDGVIIGELIDAYAPSRLTIDEVLSLIQRLEKSETSGYDGIDWNLKSMCMERCGNDDIIKWIDAFMPLIKQAPVIERPHFEVSRKYGWLLSISALLAERLVKLRHADALDDNVLEVISLAQAGRHYHDFRWEKHAIAGLVAKWPALNRRLFWFDVTVARKALDKKKEQRLTNWWQAGPMDRFWSFTADDYETVIDDVNLRLHMDDRLVALSLVFQLYREGGRGRVRLNKLKKAVQGTKELEEALTLFLHPPKMSEAEKLFRKQDAGYRRRRKKHEQTISDHRQEWFEWLQANAQVLRDTRVAAKGSIWNATDYLLNELRQKRDDRNKWAAANWEDLISDFGLEVAEAYRDGCMGYWRKYQPKTNSEGADPHGTPSAVVVGLSGIEMEVHHEPDWPKNLSDEEADSACRYALHEMNGFPDWLPTLHAVFPDAVEKRILSEIEWEFSEYDGEESCHYVLSDVFWQSDWIKPRISDRLLSYLKRYEPRHDNTVQQTLGIVLSCPGLNRENFVDIAIVKVKEIPVGYRQALWLAGWMCVESASALKALDSILSNITEPTQATEFSMWFIVALLGGRSNHGISEYHQDYVKVEILYSLIKLVHTHLRPEDDIDRIGKGTYSPGLRDNAQDARGQLYGLLFNTPGKPTYLALLDLAKWHPDRTMRQRYIVEAKRRAEADTESEPWDSGDINLFAQEAEKAPQNHRELYELAISRLLDLKDDLEGKDTSFAGTLVQVNDERLHRIFIGGMLRERSNGKYSVAQEEELASRKKPDIRFHSLNFDGPVPVELKIVDKWSGPELFERLHNQLCGQYLRDVRSTRGIYLLVYRGKKGKWQHPESRKKADFDTLIGWLKIESEGIASTDGNIEAIEIIGISL